MNKVALEKETGTGVGTESESGTETGNGAVTETVKETVKETWNGVESVIETGNGVVAESAIETGTGVVTESVIGTILLSVKIQECLEDTWSTPGVEKGKRRIHGNGKDTEITKTGTTN